MSTSATTATATKGGAATALPQEATAAERTPDLSLTQDKFLLHQEWAEQGIKDAAKSRLMKAIQEHDMSPFYVYLCDEFKWPVDKVKLTAMQRANAAKIAEFEASLEDAEKNAGQTEIFDVLLAKANYLCKIGDKEKAISAYRLVSEKTGSVGMKLDNIFSLLRLGFFYHDHDLITRNMDKAESLIEKGGDWDRRNRYKVYQATYLMSIRDFSTAATLYLDTLSTFTSTELISYKSFITYLILCAVLTQDRGALKAKVLHAPEILEVLHEMPDVERYMTALYSCQYQSFFQALSAMEDIMKGDHWLRPHYQYVVREMRIKAYAQLLESYRSVTLQSMATSFGVSEAFIDAELSRFVAAGRINAVIDKVGRVVTTNRPDAKNAQYSGCIKHGDVLLNRLQNLSRVIDV